MANIIARSAALGGGRRIHTVAARQFLVTALVFGLVWLLQERFAGVDPVNVGQSVTDIPPHSWLLAGLATCVSFWAMARHDALIHGLFGTAVSDSVARRAGVIAVAAAQFAGFGIVTGALVRWRMIPALSLWQSLRLSAGVSVAFLSGWAVFTALVLLLAPAGADWPSQLAAPVLGLAAGVALISLWQPRFVRGIPSLRAMSAIVGLVAFDTVFAGIALWLLLPPEITLTPLVLAPAFLVALGAGLIGGTPGGLGPFELTLLSLLPHVPAEPLLGAVLAYRLVYFVAPATVAAVALILGPLVDQSAPQPRLESPATFRDTTDCRNEIERSGLAEAKLLYHGELGLLSSGRGSNALAAAVGQSLVMLRQPFGGARMSQEAIEVLQDVARRRGLVPLLYKSPARQAVIARGHGWVVLHVSDEAVLFPARFDVSAPACRQLRRMLRKAREAGVTVTEAGPHLPLDAMRAIAREWTLANGGERGFVMGRFSSGHVARQRVFLAHRDGGLVGFVTCHHVAAEWTLDLMRKGNAAPSGTMHLLISHAIDAARQANVSRFSLASVPRDDLLRRGLPRWIGGILSDPIAAGGLRRFKAAFDPHWEPLYSAAPNRAALVTGLAETARAINRKPRRNGANRGKDWP